LPRPAVATIYLGRRSPGASVRPTWDVAGGQPCPCLALLRVGLAEPRRSPAALVSSYLTVSPLPRPKSRRSVLCGAFRVSPRLGVTQHPAL